MKITKSRVLNLGFYKGIILRLLTAFARCTVVYVVKLNVLEFKILFMNK